MDETNLSSAPETEKEGIAGNHDAFPSGMETSPGAGKEISGDDWADAEAVLSRRMTRESPWGPALFGP